MYIDLHRYISVILISYDVYIPSFFFVLFRKSLFIPKNLNTLLGYYLKHFSVSYKVVILNAIHSPTANSEANRYCIEKLEFLNISCLQNKVFPF